MLNAIRLDGVGTKQMVLWINMCSWCHDRINFIQKMHWLCLDRA